MPGRLGERLDAVATVLVALAVVAVQALVDRRQRRRRGQDRGGRAPRGSARVDPARRR
ncbi:hypothetical protein [Cellulosimicrobium composti]|uniref:hypothetical protein n=1 Tax=Cellulosimicrobium composti TaxID=2672572 RepID=UPI00165145B4